MTPKYNALRLVSVVFTVAAWVTIILTFSTLALSIGFDIGDWISSRVSPEQRSALQPTITAAIWSGRIIFGMVGIVQTCVLSALAETIGLMIDLEAGVRRAVAVLERIDYRTELASSRQE